MKPARSAGGRKAASDPQDEVPPLPAWKAFVVQFSRETGVEPGAFSGRVEHIESGRRARFASPDSLLAALAKMIAQLRCVGAEAKRQESASLGNPTKRDDKEDRQ